MIRKRIQKDIDPTCLVHFANVYVYASAVMIVPI